MKISLTRAQMLERRRLAGGLEPLRSDCYIEFTDGIDVDRMLEQDLRARYVWMLEHADMSMLAVDAVTGVKESPTSNGGIRLRLPASCRRPVDVEIEGWEHPATVLPGEMFDKISSWQDNPFRAATTLRPVAVLGAEGDIYAWPGGQLVSLRGICDPGPDNYVLDESGLKYLLDNGKGNTQTSI